MATLGQALKLPGIYIHQVDHQFIEDANEIDAEDVPLGIEITPETVLQLIPIDQHAENVYLDYGAEITLSGIYPDIYLVQDLEDQERMLKLGRFTSLNPSELGL